MVEHWSHINYAELENENFKFNTHGKFTRIKNLSSNGRYHKQKCYLYQKRTPLSAYKDSKNFDLFKSYFLSIPFLPHNINNQILAIFIYLYIYFFYSNVLVNINRFILIKEITYNLGLYNKNILKYFFQEKAKLLYRKKSMC